MLWFLYSLLRSPLPQYLYFVCLRHLLCIFFFCAEFLKGVSFLSCVGLLTFVVGGFCHSFVISPATVFGYTQEYFYSSLTHVASTKKVILKIRTSLLGFCFWIFACENLISAGLTLLQNCRQYAYFLFTKLNIPFFNWFTDDYCCKICYWTWDRKEYFYSQQF